MMHIYIFGSRGRFEHTKVQTYIPGLIPVGAIDYRGMAKAKCGKEYKITEAVEDHQLIMKYVLTVLVSLLF